jgi:hypothetical protein
MVRVSSPVPFTIAEEAAQLGGAAALQAQRAAACGTGVERLSLQQCFLAALHSWQFPADPHPALAKKTGRPEAAARRDDWCTAFCSLYDALRCGACDAFYYLSPEVGSPGECVSWSARAWLVETTS